MTPAAATGASGGQARVSRPHFIIHAPLFAVISRAGAIHIEGTERVNVSGCTFYRTGERGIGICGRCGRRDSLYLPAQTPTQS